MDIKSFIIGLMAMILVLIVSLGMMFSMYGEDNLDVDLSQDNTTAYLTVLQQKAQESQTEIEGYNSNMEDKVMSNISIKSDVSSADLISASWGAFTNIPSYIGVLFDLLGTIFNAMGTGFQMFAWFFIGAIIITFAIMIINAILGSRF